MVECFYFERLIIEFFLEDLGLWSAYQKNSPIEPVVSKMKGVFRDFSPKVLFVLGVFDLAVKS